MHSFVFGFLFCFVSLNLITGCAASHRADAQIIRVVDAQEKLLEKLKDERRHPGLLKRLHQDDELAQAEEHLRDSIDALIRANEELRLSMKNR